MLCRKKPQTHSFSYSVFAELIEQSLCTMGGMWVLTLSEYLKTRSLGDAPAKRGRRSLLWCVHHFGFLGFLKHGASLRSSLPWGLAGEAESLISAKHTEVLTKKPVWKHKMTPSLICFAILGICWLGASWFRLTCQLQQTFLGKLGWSQIFPWNSEHSPCSVCTSSITPVQLPRISDVNTRGFISSWFLSQWAVTLLKSMII